MTGTMARQRGRVQLEQSDIHLALNMAKMANEGFLRAVIEETQYLFTKPCAEVQEEKKLGVVFPGHKMVRAAIGRHLTLHCQNHPDWCLPCQNGTAMNPLTLWRRKGTGEPPPNWPRQLTTEPMRHLPRMPPTPPGNSAGAQCFQIVNLLAAYVYSHIPHLHAECFKLDASAQDSQHDWDFDPDMLTDVGTSTG